MSAKTSTETSSSTCGPPDLSPSQADHQPESQGFGVFPLKRAIPARPGAHAQGHRGRVRSIASEHAQGHRGRVRSIAYGDAQGHRGRLLSIASGAKHAVDVNCVARAWQMHGQIMVQVISVYNSYYHQQ